MQHPTTMSLTCHWCVIYQNVLVYLAGGEKWNISPKGVKSRALSKSGDSTGLAL